MSDIIQFIHQALQPLEDTTRWTWLVVIACMFAFISTASGLRTVFRVFGSRGEKKVIYSDDRSENVIDIHNDDLVGFGQAIDALNSGDSIILKTKEGKIRGVLQRKRVEGQRGKLTMSSRLASKLVVDAVSSEMAVTVRLPWTYGPLHLWNHPDAGIQIGVRLSVLFLAIELFLGN